LSFQVFYCITC